MQINRDADFGHYSIFAYATGEVTVAIPRRFDTRPAAADAPDFEAGAAMRRETLYRSFVIMPDKLIIDWPPQSWEELARSHFDLLAEYSLEIVLFGSGARLRHPEPHMVSTLTGLHIGVEAMDTGSACRTYNFLMSDRRRVAAALLIR